MTNVTELPDDPRALLVRTLQGAYSGELAAAAAYNGHWRSVRDPEERARIRQIELEELDHRALDGELLAVLGEGPNPDWERSKTRIGKVLSALCFVSGWFAPMYGAGRLESRNIGEYEDAARYAESCGHPEMVECLLHMAEVEWDHELYFREKAASHWMWKFFPKWQIPPPKETIRSTFAEFAGVVLVQ